MLNKVTLIGRLGRDPEIRHTSDNKPVANMTIATSEHWKDKNGEKQENTEWHRVVIFGKLAEVAEKYLKKGAMVYIEGKQKTRKWTDQSGAEKYITEVVLDVSGKMLMLGGGSGSDNASGQGNSSKQQTATTVTSKSNDGDFDQSQFDDDIPF